jgi:hypothetical protein
MTFEKLTDEHFQIFKQEVKYWVEVFGLKGWELDIKMDTESRDQLAHTTYHASNRWAEINLCMKWEGEKITEEFVRRYALHEVLELLIIPVRELCERRYTCLSEIDMQVHVVIRTLENVLLRLMGRFTE